MSRRRWLQTAIGAATIVLGMAYVLSGQHPLIGSLLIVLGMWLLVEAIEYER